MDYKVTLRRFEDGEIGLYNVLNEIEADSVCVGLITDDFGRWALTGDGFQSIREEMADKPCDVQTTFFVLAEDWHDTIHEAVIAFLKEGIDND